MIASHTLFVAEFQTILALGDLLDIIFVNQTLLVHAKFAHFTRAITGLKHHHHEINKSNFVTYRTLGQVLLNDELEIVNHLF